MNHIKFLNIIILLFFYLLHYNNFIIWKKFSKKFRLLEKKLNRVEKNVILKFFYLDIFTKKLNFS